MFNFHEQTCEVYKNKQYGTNSVYNSGCGPAALCNVLEALKLASVTVGEMCDFSVKVGARIPNVGTDMFDLLRGAAGIYGFTYETTSSNAKLKEHLKNGGAAIINNGESYKLFSNGGHFVAAVGIEGDTVTIIDSYWYSGKYDQTELRRKNVKVVSRCIVKTTIEQCGKASIDRVPSYYLITKKIKKYKTKKEINVRALPDKNSIILKKLKKGTIVNKGLLSPGENWMTYDRGWIATKHLEVM